MATLSSRIKLMKTFIELIKAKAKIYIFKDDGYYSHLEKLEDGVTDRFNEYTTFDKAKKELTKYTKQRLTEFKSGLKELPKKENDVEGDGDYFSIYWDGIYSGIERGSVDFGYKNFKEVKKEVTDFFKQQIQNWQYAWKDAVSLKEKDIE